MKDAYKGFLSDEEFEKLHLGLEFWFDADEIRKRMEQRAAVLAEEEGKENDENCSTSDGEVPEPV